MTAVSDMTRDLVCFTGRFQPFHAGHLEMVHAALGLARRVLIGVTNPDPTNTRAHAASAHRHRPDANPLSYPQRAAMITAALARDGIPAERFQITPFPLDTPTEWSSLLPPATPQLVRVFSDWEREKVRRFTDAGYPVIVLEGDPAARISGSDIRRQLARGEAWEHWVPPGARELVARFQGTVRANEADRKT